MAGTITGIKNKNVSDGVIAGVSASAACFIGSRAYIPGVDLGTIASGATAFCTTLSFGLPLEAATLTFQNISYETKVKKPVSNYLGGSTKISCGPYRRGWTQVLYKRSCQRMRSASYFYKNIIY